MKKFPKEDSSECVKKALAKEGKKECMECAKCEKPKQKVLYSRYIKSKILLGRHFFKAFIPYPRTSAKNVHLWLKRTVKSA